MLMKIPPLPCFPHTSLVHKSTSEEQRRRNRRGEEESRTRQREELTEVTEGKGGGKERRERDGPGVRRDGPRLASRDGPGSGQRREEKGQKRLARSKEGMPRFREKKDFFLSLKS